MSENTKRLSDEDLHSLREWLAHWGDGPNWVDQRVVAGTISPTTMTQLINEVVRLRRVIEDARRRVLDHRPNRIDQLFKANLAALLDQALDDNRDGFFPEREFAAPLQGRHDG